MAAVAESWRCYVCLVVTMLLLQAFCFQHSTVGPFIAKFIASIFRTFSSIQGY